MAPKGKLRRWDLFLDESGDFTKSEDAVCIAGILVQEDRAEDLTTLRAKVAALEPVMPYPPHASHQNLPATHLAAYLLADEQQRASQPGIELLRTAAAEAQAIPQRQIEAFVAALKPRDMPRYEALEDVSTLLRVHYPHAHDLLTKVATDTSARTRQLIAGIGQQYGPDRCFVVAAAERRRADDAEGDRYVALLETLLRRVFGILRTRPMQRQQVWVHAAQRDVVGEVRRQMVSRDVALAIRAAERFPIDPPAGDTDEVVRLIAGVPPAYDRDTHPFIVVADFIANRMRKPLRSRGRWAEVVADVLALTGLGAEARPGWLPSGPPLPASTAHGAADRAVTLAFDLGRQGQAIPAPRLANVLPGWAREQAEQWISVAPLARGSR